MKWYISKLLFSLNDTAIARRCVTYFYPSSFNGLKLNTDQMVSLLPLVCNIDEYGSSCVLSDSLASSVIGIIILLLF